MTLVFALDCAHSADQQNEASSLGNRCPLSLVSVRAVDDQASVMRDALTYDHA